MVQKYTADGLRYWSSGCKLGTDTLYDEKLLGEGKRLITKLFNASKFALRHLLDFDPGSARLCPRSAGGQAAALLWLRTTEGGAALSGRRRHGGQWTAAPTSKTCSRSSPTPPTAGSWRSWPRRSSARTKANDNYEFGDAKQAAEDFFWADFCDNYLELSKGRLYGEPLALDAHPGSGRCGAALKRAGGAVHRAVGRAAAVRPRPAAHHARSAGAGTSSA